MILGSKDLRSDRLLVAELGNNHEGDPSIALELVDAAAQAGADAVKVQVIDPERLVHHSQIERIQQLSKFRLPFSVFEEMADRAIRRNMLFIASAFDIRSLERISELTVATKIASGDLDYTPLLIRAAQIGKPIMLSTGMATLDEIRTAVDVIAHYLPPGSSPDGSLALLHCVSLYPTPWEQAALRDTETLGRTFNLVTGYSDHTLGVEMAALALAFGARIVEKHFTLDKNRSSFRDHQLSADPEELGKLATIVHEFDRIVGTGAKLPSPAEREMARAARRTIVASRAVPKGTRLTADDLDYIRPRNDGLSPSAGQSLIGRKLLQPLDYQEVIVEGFLE
ncbi:MAG: N-acetylneuraminate synthase family protein [Thermodesulfobacteriota bacterium]